MMEIEYSALGDPSPRRSYGGIVKIVLLCFAFVLLVGASSGVVFFFLNSKISQLQGQIGDLQTANQKMQEQNQFLINQTTLLVEALLKINVTEVSQEIDTLKEEISQYTNNMRVEVHLLEVNLGSLTALVSSPKPPCNLQCGHGGYPSPDCSTCSGCQNGWTGVLCNVPSSCSAYCTEKPCFCYNGGNLESSSCTCSCLPGWIGNDCSTLDTSVTPQGRISTLEALKNQSLAARKLLKGGASIPYDLGNGVDMTERNIGLPVLSMTFDSNNTQSVITPNNVIYNIPDGAAYEEILGGLEWPVDQTILFENFNQYVSQLFQWSNQDGYVKPPMQGVSLQQIQDIYFVNTSIMTQTQSFYGAYGLSLSKSLSSYQLEHHAKAALDYISQLPFNAANQQVFYYFLDNWGTHVIVDEVQGGLLQFACIVPGSIWNWGGQGQVSPDFIQGQAAGYFNDKTQGTSLTSGVFTQSSVCEFYCNGGNPEQCPTASKSVNTGWSSTIWANPQSVKYSVVPLSEVITNNQAKQTIQTAIYSYYASQSNQWLQNVTSCLTCLPALNSFLIAANIPFDTPTTVHAGTCSSAIRVAATGACFYIMSNNGNPINGGNSNCDRENAALWGIAAPESISNPVVEWLVTDVNQDNTFVSAKCNYNSVNCVYWTGQYSLFCV